MVKEIVWKTNFDMLIANLTSKNKNYKLFIDMHNCSEHFEDLIYELRSRGYRWMLEDYHSCIRFITITNGLKELGYSIIDTLQDYINSDYNVYVVKYNDLTFDFDNDENDDKIDDVVSDIEGISEKNIIYISGAITGTDDYIERFEKAEKELKERGYEVINPAKFNSYLPETTTWEQYMEIDYKLLDICDTIYMLNGWENSKGANAELDYAKQNSKMIVYQPTNKFTVNFGYDSKLIICKFENNITIDCNGDSHVLTDNEIKKFKEILK